MYKFTMFSNNTKTIQWMNLEVSTSNKGDIQIYATDSLYYRNLHNADKWPWSQIIPYSLLNIAISV